MVVGGTAGVRRLPSEAREDHVATEVAWTPDGRLVVGTHRGRVLVIDPENGATLAAGEAGRGPVRRLVVSPDGRHVAVDTDDQGVGRWRVDTGARVATFAGRARAVAFSDAGLVIHDGRLRTWRIPTGAPTRVQAGAGLSDVVAAPTGDRVLAVGGGGTTLEVDLRDGAAAPRAFGREVVKTTSRGPAGRLVTGLDGPRLAWMAAGGRFTPLPGARPLRRVVQLDDGVALGADFDRGLYRWADGAPRRLALDRQFVDLETDGARAWAVDVDGRVDRVDGETLVPLDAPAGARAVVGRGTTVVVATGDALHLLGADRVLPTGGSVPLDLALAPDARRVAAALLDGRVRVWDLADGRRVGELPGHAERAVAVAFLPDGDLVSASWHKTVRLWDLRALDATREELATEVAVAWPDGDGLR